MGLAANHAAMAAPMQGMTELSLGILLVIGLLTRPPQLCFSVSRQPLDFGVGHLVDLDCWFRCSHRSARYRTRRPEMCVDAWLSQRWPSLLW